MEVLQDADAATLLPRPGATDQKYTRGVLGVLAGSAEYPGAGILACTSAVRAGWAGMVRYAGAAADLVHARLPEVVGDGRVQACVVGPGGGSSAGDQLSDALRRDVPVVVDADALQHVSASLRSDAVLTPHAGELASMLQVARPDVEAAPLRHLQTAVDRFGCVVLLKGARTLVGAPGRPVRSTPPASRGWPPPARGTSSPAWSARCSRPASGRTTPRARRLPARPGRHYCLGRGPAPDQRRGPGDGIARGGGQLTPMPNTTWMPRANGVPIADRRRPRRPTSTGEAPTG